MLRPFYHTKHITLFPEMRAGLSISPFFCADFLVVPVDFLVVELEAFSDAEDLELPPSFFTAVSCPALAARRKVQNRPTASEPRCDGVTQTNSPGSVEKERITSI